MWSEIYYVRKFPLFIKQFVESDDIFITSSFQLQNPIRVSVFFFSFSWDGVRLSPLGTSATVLLYQPRMIGWCIMSVEQSVEWELAGETDVLELNIPQCQFVHHKSHMVWPGFEPGPLGWEADD
jgi:hypothetical protein